MTGIESSIIIIEVDTRQFVGILNKRMQLKRVRYMKEYGWPIVATKNGKKRCEKTFHKMCWPLLLIFKKTKH